MAVTHIFVSAKPDDPDSSLVRPSDWNAAHAVAIAESDLSLSDLTTDDVTTARHGFAPKAPGDATKYLDGTGAYSVPPAPTVIDGGAP